MQQQNNVAFGSSRTSLVKKCNSKHRERLLVEGENVRRTESSHFQLKQEPCAVGKDSTTQNVVPVFIHIGCNCAALARTSQVSIQEPEVISYDTESDSDKDDDEFTIELLIKHLSQYEDISVSSNPSSKVLNRLAYCIKPTKSITEEHLRQMSGFLSCKNPIVEEVCLIALDGLLSSFSFCDSLLHNFNLFDNMVTFCMQSICSHVQILALKVLDKLLKSPALKDDEVQSTVEKLLCPFLINCLHQDELLEIKFAACCVLRTLACKTLFAAKIKSESVFILHQIQTSGVELMEVYAGILTALFAYPNLVENASLDKSVLPVIRTLLQEGPCKTQKYALSLLLSLMSSVQRMEIIAHEPRIVAYTVSCLLMSPCRKVRAQSSEIFATLTFSKNMVMAQKLMEGISLCLQFDSVPRQLKRMVSTVSLPGGNRQSDVQLWHNFDRFLDYVACLTQVEGDLDMDTDIVICRLPVKGDISTVQLSCLHYLVQLVVNMCSWPVIRKGAEANSRQILKRSLTNLSKDEVLIGNVSALNTRLTVEQWHRFGTRIFAIFKFLSQRIDICLSNLQKHEDSSPFLGNLSKRSLKIFAQDIISSEELHLLIAILQFLLFAALVTCKQIGDPCADDSLEALHRNVNVLSQMSNYRTSGVSPEGSSQRMGNERGLSLPKKTSALEREALSERRCIRRHLYNANLFELMGPIMQLEDEDLKILSCLLLRAAVQSLEENDHVFVRSGSSKSLALSDIKAASVQRVRPQSGGIPLHEGHTKNAVHHKSPTALATKNARMTRSSSASNVRSAVIPAGCSYQSDSKVSLKSEGQETLQRKSFLVTGQLINQECLKGTLLSSGIHILSALFSNLYEVKHYSLLLIHDIVKFGAVDIHMYLSKLGAIPKLLDFIRVNDETEQLIVIGLIVVRKMVLSDHRLLELFSFHGGHNLLIALVHHKSPNVRAQVCKTLAAVSKLNKHINTVPCGKVQRPVSSQFANITSKPRDVWEHIMERWKEEDKVMKVLQKFL